MVAIDKYTIDGAEDGKEQLDVDLESLAIDSELVKRYIISYRNNQRQHTAHTKTRGEVSGSTKKIRKQKGTGRARAGSIRTSQRRGGGVAHGPRACKPKLAHINVKEKQSVRRGLLAEKLSRGDILVLKDPSEAVLSLPSTKKFAHFLQALNLSETKVGFVCGTEGGRELDTSRLSLRNIGKATFFSFNNINPYEILNEKKLVVFESALPDLKKVLVYGGLNG